MGAEKKKTGRPKTEIDLKQAYQLGKIDCTLDECAAILSVPMSTLSTHKEFSEAYKSGKAEAKRSLRRKLWDHVEAGNVPVAIFLSKNLLGYRDNPEQTVDQDHELSFTGFNAKQD